MDRTYIDSQSSCFYNSILKKCMGKGHKKPKCLFNPRITEEWKEGGTLVVGINHWCPQEGCEYYEDCVVNCNSVKYDKKCEWAVSEVDETVQYDLRYTTYEAFNCYFEHFPGYECFKEFLLYITGTQDCMEPDEQRKYWNHLAFYNYIQHFTKMSLTHTSMYGVEEALSKREDEDFAAFVDVLHDLKPRLVIVWHKDIKNLLLRKIEEGKIPAGRKLQLVDDLGIPTKSMFRFVYQEKKAHKQEDRVARIIRDFEKSFGGIDGFFTDQVLLRLLRWNMFKTENDLALLTQLPVSSDVLKKMLEATEEYAWDSDVLISLVERIQNQLGITSVLNAVPYGILRYKDSVLYSNVLLTPQKDIQVCPMVGIYPEDCSHYSLKKYEEKDLLSLTGLSFDGLRSKTYIDDNAQAQGFVIYIDENHPLSEAFFKHLFEAKLDKKGHSMLIMKNCEENDNRYLGILKESNRLHTIKSKAIGNEAYLFIKLLNAPEFNRQVQIEDKEHRIFNKKLNSLLPVKLNSNSYGKIDLELKVTETEKQKAAMERQIKQLLEEKIDAADYLIERLKRCIIYAFKCGLLSMDTNKMIVYKTSFGGGRKCYNLFCRGVYDKVINRYKGKRGDVIKSIFGHSYVANVSYSKTKEDLENKGFEAQVKLIELCIYSEKIADFERVFKNIMKL